MAACTVCLQEWSQSVWSAAEQATRRNAEAAESIGRNLGDWAAGIGRAFKGAPCVLSGSMRLCIADAVAQRPWSAPRHLGVRAATMRSQRPCVNDRAAPHVLALGAGSLDSTEQSAEELAKTTTASFVEGGKTAPGAVAGRESRETMWRRPVDPPKPRC